jgi:hypothetical protein
MQGRTSTLRQQLNRQEKREQRDDDACKQDGRCALPPLPGLVRMSVPAPASRERSGVFVVRAAALALGSFHRLPS